MSSYNLMDPQGLVIYFYHYHKSSLHMGTGLGLQSRNDHDVEYGPTFTVHKETCQAMSVVYTNLGLNTAIPGQRLKEN